MILSQFSEDIIFKDGITTSKISDKLFTPKYPVNSWRMWTQIFLYTDSKHDKYWHNDCFHFLRAEWPFKTRIIIHRLVFSRDFYKALVPSVKIWPFHLLLFKMCGSGKRPLSVLLLIHCLSYATYSATKHILNCIMYDEY